MIIQRHRAAFFITFLSFLLVDAFPWPRKHQVAGTSSRKDQARAFGRSSQHYARCNGCRDRF
jgi:hypothetical protein